LTDESPILGAMIDARAVSGIAEGMSMSQPAPLTGALTVNRLNRLRR
jgi:hypothetical protein